MRSLQTILGIALAAGAAANAQAGGDVLLYSNGTPPPLLSTGPTSNSGVASPVGTTWSECQNVPGDLTIANTNAGFGANVGAQRMADDFTVPAPGWVVNFVDLYGYRTGAPATPSPFTATTLRIWGPCTAGTRPGDVGCTTIAFGDTTTNRLVTSTDVTMFRVFNTVVAPATAPGTTRKIWRNRVAAGVSLTPGLYWIDWDSTAGGNHFYPGLTPVGVRSLPGWNARQLTLPAATWGDAIDPGQGPAAPVNVVMDMPFELQGVIVPVELQSFEIK
jgi:hypothetical protein